MNYTDKVITMKSGEKYIVIEQVDYEDNTYLYLVNKHDDTDAMFAQIKDEKILKIDSELFEKNILPLFMEKIQAS